MQDTPRPARSWAHGAALAMQGWDCIGNPAKRLGLNPGIAGGTPHCTSVPPAAVNLKLKKNQTSNQKPKL